MALTHRIFGALSRPFRRMRMAADFGGAAHGASSRENVDPIYGAALSAASQRVPPGHRERAA